jgi:hypothetical protein
MEGGRNEGRKREEKGKKLSSGIMEIFKDERVGESSVLGCARFLLDAHLNSTLDCGVQAE